MFGTVISETTVNSEMDDIATALTASIAKDGQTVPTANLPMGTYKHTNVAEATARTDYARASQVQDSSFVWCNTAGGTADAFTLSPSPSITAYAAGQSFRFLAVGTNTTAVTVNVSALGAKAVQISGGALSGGEIVSGKLYSITYDGTQFQLEAVSVSAFIAKLLNDTDAATALATLGALALAGGSMTGDIVLTGNAALETARANITMHATTMDPWAGPNILDGTGAAVTVTAIANAPQAGAVRIIYPPAGSVITDGATFDVQGGANHTAEAGDGWVFEAITTSTHRVHIIKADGTAVIPGAVLQIAYAELATSATTTALIPTDDTIPQNTEGAEILTCSITPTAATSYLLIEVSANLAEDTNTLDGSVIAAIFRDSTADAICAQAMQIHGVTSGIFAGIEHGIFSMRVRVAAGSTSATTFKLRVGGETAGTYRWNGVNGSRRFGGTYLTTMTVTEIAA